MNGRGGDLGTWEGEGGVIFETTQKIPKFQIFLKSWLDFESFPNSKIPKPKPLSSFSFFAFLYRKRLSQKTASPLFFFALRRTDTRCSMLVIFLAPPPLHAKPRQ